MTLETQQPDLKQEQLQDAKGVLGEKTLKKMGNVEKLPEGPMKAAEKLKQKEGAINSLLKLNLPSGSDKIKGSVVELKETKDYLPASVFVDLGKQYLPKTHHITAEKLKGTQLSQQELQSLLTNFFTLKPGSLEHKQATKTIQTKVLHNKDTMRDYYPKEKNGTSADGKPGPYTVLALLKFLSEDLKEKIDTSTGKKVKVNPENVEAYKNAVSNKINEHNKAIGSTAVFTWMNGS